MAEEIKVGDKVRSYDFAGVKNCYVEGVVVAFVKKEDCTRYKIAVKREVFDGEECGLSKIHAYPPVNGTPTSFGKITNCVEKI